MLGKRGEATRILDSNLIAYTRSIEEGDENLSTPVFLSQIYSLRGDTSRAIQWLQHAVDMGYRDYRWSSVDPLMENLRPTASFKAIMANLKAMVDVMRKRVQESEAKQTQS
jgi:hypothetical protein